MKVFLTVPENITRNLQILTFSPYSNVFAIRYNELCRLKCFIGVGTAIVWLEVVKLIRGDVRSISQTPEKSFHEQDRKEERFWIRL